MLSSRLSAKPSPSPPLLPANGDNVVNDQLLHTNSDSEQLTVCIIF